jgi:hypothetical protein
MDHSDLELPETAFTMFPPGAVLAFGIGHLHAEGSDLIATMVACVVAFVTALVVGVGCLALFFLGSLGDMSELTGVYEAPFIYAGLPCAVLLGFSVAFAHWRLSAARVFAIASVVAFFGPLILLLAITTRPRTELLGFLVMAALSLLANWIIASLARQQLDKARTPAVNAGAPQ